MREKPAFAHELVSSSALSELEGLQSEEATTLLSKATLLAVRMCFQTYTGGRCTLSIWSQEDFFLCG